MEREQIWPERLMKGEGTTSLATIAKHNIATNAWKLKRLPHSHRYFGNFTSNFYFSLTSQFVSKGTQSLGESKYGVTVLTE